MQRPRMLSILMVWALLVPNSQAADDDYLEPRLRDPFTPSLLMYGAAGSQAGPDAGRAGFMPADNPFHAIPNMRLRGFVNQPGGAMLALLEVTGKGVYMVREGDEINIDPRMPNAAIRITQISRLGITVETGTIGRIRIPR